MQHVGDHVAARGVPARVLREEGGNIAGCRSVQSTRDLFELLEVLIGSMLGGQIGHHGFERLPGLDQRLQRRRDAAECAAQQLAIQRLLVTEVVVQHRLVDAGPAGDAVDAGARKRLRGGLALDLRLYNLGNTLYATDFYYNGFAPQWMLGTPRSAEVALTVGF